MIRYLRHNEIDREAWDRVVMEWSGQPYGLSWWLDIVSPGWEGVVDYDNDYDNDYDYDHNRYRAVMALPVKRRYGLRYLVQPRFCQQLGVFGQEDTDEFLRAVPYWSYDVNLNYRNRFGGKSFRWHTNYIIYNESGGEAGCESGFDSNTKRNIRKADKELTYGEVSSSDFMDLWRSENGRFGDGAAEMLEKLVTECVKQGMAVLLGAYFGPELVSAIFAILTNDRVVLLAPVSDEMGKRKSAMFGIMSYIIKNNQDKIIDCEGSMLPGVARFYRGFGGVEQNYRRVWRLSWREKK